MSSLYISAINALTDSCVNIFSHSTGCPFILLIFKSLRKTSYSFKVSEKGDSEYEFREVAEGGQDKSSQKNFTLVGFDKLGRWAGQTKVSRRLG